MKLARANRDTFLYRHSGITTPIVTTKTIPSRTEPIDVPHIGKKRIKTLDIVSPTTTLYDIIAANFQTDFQCFYRASKRLVIFINELNVCSFQIF